MKKSFKLFIGALVLTFLVSQSLLSESRCQKFYSEILDQDIGSDVYKSTVSPIASLGFQKEYYYDKKNDAFEWLKDDNGYFSVGKIEKDDLINKVNYGDKIISVNGIDIRKYNYKYASDDFFEDLFEDNQNVKIKIKNLNTGKFYEIETKKEILEPDNVYVDFYIKHIKLNEKEGTFDLTMQKDFAFSNLGENFTLTQIAKNTLVDENKNYEYCPFSVEQFKKLDTLDPNNGMTVGNEVKRDKSLIQERYEFEPFIDEDEVALDVLFKSSGTTTIRNKYDLKSFPFDKQKIRINIHQTNYTLETYRLEESTFAHAELAHFIKKDAIQGWNVVNSKINQRIHFDPKWSQYFDGVEITLDIERESAYYIFKIILPIILILVVCWSSIWITPREIESRLTITIVCLLSLIAYNFVIDSELPKLEYLTTMDFIILMSYIYAAIPNFLSIYSHRRFLAKNKAKIKDLELYGRRYGFISYLSIIVIIIIINTNMSPDNTKAFLNWMALAQ